MSISNFQEKIFKGGCGMTILFSLAVIMTVSMFYGACDNRQRQSTPENVAVAFTVGSTPVRADVVQMGIQDQIKQTNQQFGGMSDMLPLTFQANAAGQAIQIIINAAAYLPLAEKNGVKLDDAALLAASKAEFEETKANVRNAYIQQGLIKPAATDKEFDEAVKKKEGRTISEIEKERDDNLQKALADAGKKEDLRISLAKTALEQSLIAKVKITDDEVKKSFETVSYKKIFFRNGAPGGTAMVRAEAALKAIKGGLKFEAAMDKYSNDIPPTGKKISETPALTAGGAALEGDPSLAPLKTLQPKQNSEIVDVPDGKAIYHVISRDPNLPKDLTTAMETYRRQIARQRVQADVAKQLDEIKKQPGFIKWAAPGYEALYEYTQTPGASMFSGGQLDTTKMQFALELAKKAMAKNKGFDEQAATLAYYGTVDALYNAPGADKAKLRVDRIDSIEKVLQSNESFRLRLDLVDLYVEDNALAKAADQLTMAAQFNTSLDDAGKSRYDQLFQKVTQLRAQNKLSPELAKPIIAALEQWKKDKAEADKQAAELKKAEEEAKKTSEPAKKDAKAGQ